MEVPGARAAQRIAAAANAELAGYGGQGQHRRRGVAAVAVALETPAAADDRGGGFGVQLREPFEQLGVDVGDRGCPLDWPLRRTRPQQVGAAGVLRQEVLIRQLLLEQKPVQR